MVWELPRCEYENVAPASCASLPEGVDLGLGVARCEYENVAPASCASVCAGVRLSARARVSVCVCVYVCVCARARVAVWKRLGDWLR